VSFCARGWGAGEGLGGAAVRGSLVGEAVPGVHSISTGAKIDLVTVGRSRPPGIRGPQRASVPLRHPSSRARRDTVRSTDGYWLLQQS